MLRLGILELMEEFDGMVELLSSTSDEDLQQSLDNLKTQIGVFRKLMDNDVDLVKSSDALVVLSDPTSVFRAAYESAASSGQAASFLRMLHCALLVPSYSTPVAESAWQSLAETCTKLVTGIAGDSKPAVAYSELDGMIKAAKSADETLREAIGDIEEVACLSEERDMLKETLASARSANMEMSKKLEEIEEAHKKEVLELRDEIVGIKNDFEKMKEAAVAKAKAEAAKAAAAAAAIPVQAGAAAPAPGNALDPKYAKYDKMRKMKLPDGAIRQAMQRDGVDPEPFFSAPAAAMPAQVPAPALDPKYAKYAKMRKMKMPEGAIRQAMQRDGVDPEPFFSAPAAAIPAQVPAPALDPKYAKYAKMRKMKMPEGAIRQAMQRDGVDPEPFFSAPAAATPAQVPAPALDAKYAKYEKMRKMKMPEGAIRQAMQRDGVDPEPFFRGPSAPAAPLLLLPQPKSQLLLSIQSTQSMKRCAR